MDEWRAKQITASPVMADVTYNGTPIYIESVSESKGTARIHYINKASSSFEVSLNSLIEHR